MNQTEKLEKLGIHIEPGNPKNVNLLAIVDKRMEEFRNILRKIAPEGSQLSLIQLSQATSQLNDMIRRLGLSSREIFTGRNQSTGE